MEEFGATPFIRKSKLRKLKAPTFVRGVNLTTIQMLRYANSVFKIWTIPSNNAFARLDGNSHIREKLVCVAYVVNPDTTIDETAGSVSTIAIKAASQNPLNLSFFII